MRRRTVLTGIAATLGLGGIAATSQPAEGVTIDNLSVPDNTLETSQPITSLTLGVTGTYNFTTVANPTRVVIRLEVGHNDVESQVGAISLDTIKTNTDANYTVQAALSNHPEIDTSELTPSNIGNTVSIPLAITVTCEIYEDGNLLQEFSDSTNTTLEITKTEVSVSIAMNGTVNFDMTTESP